MIESLKQTCEACPSQWEAITDDRRPVYVRYRGGWLTIGVSFVGGTLDDAVARSDDFSVRLGDMWDGEITWPEVAHFVMLAIHARQRRDGEMDDFERLWGELANGPTPSWFDFDWPHMQSGAELERQIWRLGARMNAHPGGAS